MRRSWTGTSATAIQARSGVLEEEVSERCGSDRHVHDERVAHVLEERLDAVHVERHLIRERARAPGGEERHRQALHLVDDEAAQTRDRGPHEALRADVCGEREPSVDGQEREVGQRVVTDEIEPSRGQDSVDEVPEAGREGDMRDRLEGLPESAERDELRFDAEEHPEAIERAPVLRPRERQHARSWRQARRRLTDRDEAVVPAGRTVREGRNPRIPLQAARMAMQWTPRRPATSLGSARMSPLALRSRQRVAPRGW